MCAVIWPRQPRPSTIAVGLAVPDHLRVSAEVDGAGLYAVEVERDMSYTMCGIAVDVGLATVLPQEISGALHNPRAGQEDSIRHHVLRNRYSRTAAPTPE